MPPPKPKPKPTRLTATQEIVAGFAAGVADAVACHPVDVVKTRAHVNRGANAPFVRELARQASSGGIRSLYRGVLPAAARPQALVMYVGNEHSKRLVVGERGTLTTPTAFAAAFLTGVPESICVTPFEAVKCRMQARENASRYAHSWQCARTMVATEGAASLYSGFYATIGRNCVFNAFYFGSIFFAKENLMEAPRTVSEQVAQSLATGLLGGLVATAFKMPFDVVKSRMQSRVPDVKTGRAEYAGVTDAFAKIVRTEGWRALYKGTAVTALRISLGFPVSLVAWDLTVWGMRAMNNDTIAAAAEKAGAAVEP